MAVIVLLSSPVFAQDVFPPENARIVTASRKITLRWPASSENSFLEVFLGQKAIVDRPVEGNSASVPLPANAGYRWRVSTRAEASVAGFHRFQILSTTTFHFDGKPGIPPPPAPLSPTNYHLSSAPASLDGQNGDSVKIDMEPLASLTQWGTSADFLNVTIRASRETDTFLMDPSTTLTVTARGGDGAVGPHGTMPVQIGGLKGPNDYNPYPGTPGGKGGNGGKGGLVTVHCADSHWQTLVHVDNNGGAGGPGGPGASQGPPGKAGANGVVHRS